jgi:CheY-like chemotaxis protein
MNSQLTRNSTNVSTSSSRPLVLVIEHENNDYQVIHNSFQKSATAAQLHRCQTGTQALEYLGKAVCENTIGKIPAMILLDLNVPEIEGCRVLKIIKEDPILHFIPTVILTRSEHSKDIKKCYELGVGGYVLKSLDLERFEQSVVVVSEFWLNRVTLPEFAAILQK